MRSIIIFILFILLFSCKKTNDVENFEDYSFESQKNGVQWNALAIAILHHNRDNKEVLSIDANIFNKVGYLRESLHIGNLNVIEGKQKLLNRIPNSPIDTIYASYTTFMADGDVIEDRFDLYELEQNYINVKSIDYVKMKMIGTYQLSFVRDPNDPVTNSDLPYTIRFTEGEFNIKIEDVR